MATELTIRECALRLLGLAALNMIEYVDEHNCSDKACWAAMRQLRKEAQRGGLIDNSNEDQAERVAMANHD